MTRCFIALGSNLAQPLSQVSSAVEALKTLPHSSLISVSPWYQSKAIGPGTQDDYINGVAELDTACGAEELLLQLQAIENAQGRERTQRWGARTLDLDLLLYGNQVIDLPTLTVPHPRMLQRNFVLYPLFDIAPQLNLPDGSPLQQHRDSCGADNLSLVDTEYPNTISSPASTITTHGDRH